MSSRQGGVRLIEWTGERCVPWAPDVQMVYEHYHRYLWAQPLVEGKRVLDLGSGEGFGASILAESAQAVLGIDADPLTVEHASLNYVAPGLSFREGSALALGDLADGSFDVVVAFELIEHVMEQGDLLAEISRVLAADGFLLLSTPDRRTYEPQHGENPYHVRELTLDELRELLHARFEHVELLNQRVATGTTLDSLERRDGSHLRLRLERAGEGWRVPDDPPPYYLLAVASNAQLPSYPSESTLSDAGIELLRAAEGTTEAEPAQTRETLLARQRFATSRLDDMRALARTREELASTHDELRRVYGEIGVLREEAARLQASVAWRLFQNARRRAYARLGGHSSRGGALLALAMRLIGRAAFGRASPARKGGGLDEKVTFPETADPVVSIVIPVHGEAVAVQTCLRAVAETADVPYEVILVDDKSNVDTAVVARSAKGARYISNDANLGYLRSVNRGAAQARGRYIVLLNDDTEPAPMWLSAMVERVESAPDIGVVAAKLIYPSGPLREAGGIVWDDGQAENFGRNDDPAAPPYNYVREVDYGSAAALLVRAEVWEQVGGFDERFVPAYWEDTDLCFSARKNGWRVMYEPAGEVTHVEGGSMGTSLEASGKYHQRPNQAVFAVKWGEALQRQPSRSMRSYLGSDHRRAPVVLVVDDKVPTPDRDSGSTRMLAIVEGLLSLGCRVLFVPDNGAAVQPYTRHLEALGVETLTGVLDMRARLAEIGSSLELAILSRPYVAPRYLHLIRTYNRSARIAYDTVDLHYVREERRQRQDGSTDMSVPDAFRHLELANARAADVTFVVSEAERTRLLEDCPGLEVEVVPNAHDVAEAVPGPTSRAGLLFVGGFQHHPNVDAALYLCNEIMPLVRSELNGVNLSLVGPNPPSTVRTLAAEGVDVTGWIEDLGPLLETSTVCVAPVRYGGGMNGKITQSLAAGLPVVSTSVGSEGLGAEDGKHMFVADDPRLFAQRVVELHRDNDLWRTMSEGGRAIAREVASRERQLDPLRRVLNAD